MMRRKPIVFGCFLLRPHDIVLEQVISRRLYRTDIEDRAMAPNDGKVSVAEIAKHSSAEDCWVVVNGKVYDLSMRHSID